MAASCRPGDDSDDSDSSDTSDTSDESDQSDLSDWSELPEWSELSGCRGRVFLQFLPMSSDGGETPPRHNYLRTARRAACARASEGEMRSENRARRRKERAA